MNINYDKYDIKFIYQCSSVFREWRGKEIQHDFYKLIFNDQSILEIFVPYYFEELGTERRFISALEKNRLKNRNGKIKNIINKIV